MKCKQIKLTQVNFHERLIFGAKYSRMDQVEFVETAFTKFEVIWSASTDRITLIF